MNEEGTECVDTEYVFVNQKYCELVNKTKDELIGHRFSEKFADTGSDWFPFCYRAAILGEEINETIFSTETQLWLNFTIAPTSIPNHCAYTFMNIDKEHKDRALFDKMGNTDKAIIRIVETLNKRLPTNRPSMTSWKRSAKSSIPTACTFWKPTAKQWTIPLSGARKASRLQSRCCRIFPMKAIWMSGRKR